MRDRIDELIKYLDISPTQFAQKVGIQRSTLQHILNGRNEPSLNVVKSIHSALPSVNLDWLLTGNGQIFTTESSADMSTDESYPLFKGLENTVFPSDVRSPAEYSIPDKAEKPKKQNKLADNKKVINTVTTTEKSEGLRIKEVIVFFEDGTYQKISRLH